MMQGVRSTLGRRSRGVYGSGELVVNSQIRVSAGSIGSTCSLLFSKRPWQKGSFEALAPIVNARNLMKAYGGNPLFQNVSFTVSEGDRIGLIGPNGSGKSTLLGILAGRVLPDDGDLAVRKRTRMSYVAQESCFDASATVRQVVEEAMRRAEVDE